MNARLIAIGLLLTILTAQPLAAQVVPQPNPSQWSAEASVTSPSRLAAGLRAYPDNELEALLTLADQPDLVRQLAERPEFLDAPDRIEPPVTDAVKSALVELRANPRIIAMAADHPTELEQLRTLHDVAPDGLRLRLKQVREDYERWSLAAAGAWQLALERNPVALGEYRELLTRLCDEERAADAEFPYVLVTNREYYAACVPDDLFVSFLARQAGFTALKQVIEPWWATYAPERVDQAAQSRSIAPDATALAAPPKQTRAAMWRPAEAKIADVIGMVPIIMQPLADQPTDAQQEYALAEHARLWSPPVPPIGTPRAGDLAEAIENQPEVPEEPIAEAVDWPEMKQIGAYTGHRSPIGGGYRSWYGGGGYLTSGVTLGYSGYGGIGLYGGYGGIGYYSGPIWTYSAGHERCDDVGGLRIYYGPTPYTLGYSGHGRTAIGVRRYYRSTPQRAARGLRRHVSPGVQFNDQSRRAPDTHGRLYRSSVPQRLPSGGTIGLQRRSTIGTRGPTTIGQRPATLRGQGRSTGYLHRTGIRRGFSTGPQSVPHARTSSAGAAQPHRRR